MLFVSLKLLFYLFFKFSEIIMRMIYMLFNLMRLKEREVKSVVGDLVWCFFVYFVCYDFLNLFLTVSVLQSTFYCVRCILVKRSFNKWYFLPNVTLWLQHQYGKSSKQQTMSNWDLGWRLSKQVRFFSFLFLNSLNWTFCKKHIICSIIPRV